jgi:hypothetical protein
VLESEIFKKLVRGVSANKLLTVNSEEGLSDIESMTRHLAYASA